MSDYITHIYKNQQNFINTRLVWELTFLMRQVILKLELHMIHVKPLYFQNIHMTVRRSIAIILDRTVVVPFDSDESF